MPTIGLTQQTGYEMDILDVLKKALAAAAAQDSPT